MTALTWVLIAVGLMTVAACVVRVHRMGGPSREVAIALPVAAALALPGLLADQAPAVVWGLWGATTIAAALTWAVANTLRDIPDRAAGKARSTS
ncbi:hypothetical protein [Streptomyces chiangmaiensis]|uniref:Integral membrane protein n=1 Tax=Streptomyces chiangmaiensis TaxID=766497 RepID=A0ABU7FN85_9ACTN|nr:hypothetical protein [Streptomyces chiangmaiensis]MED7824559.1 hypothetical protein [Streptomyces chiangmaiensis]